VSTFDKPACRPGLSAAADVGIDDVPRSTVAVYVRIIVMNLVIKNKIILINYSGNNAGC